MSTDQIVTATHVLSAMMELDRRGSTQVLTELEKLEPDLTEWLLENLTRLHHGLNEVGFSNKDARKVYRLARKTTLVCIIALRQAYRDLLDDQAGAPASKPDPDAAPPAPPS